MPWDSYGQWHPSRRSEHHCSVCKRIFAAHAVPSPMADGSRICRDCRWATNHGVSRETSPPGA